MASTPNKDGTYAGTPQNRGVGKDRERILRYPEKPISKKDDYLLITTIDYIPPGLATNTGGFGNASQLNNFDILRETDRDGAYIKQYIENIILPLPRAITDGQSASWGEDSVNALIAAGIGVAQSAITEGLGEAAATIGNVFNNAGKDTSKITSAATGLAVNSLVGNSNQLNINSLVSRATGQIVNPNVELLFNGVTLRGGFNFQFDMMPRSSTEGQNIRKIIRVFKKNMVPSKGAGTNAASGFFVKSPKVFLLRFMQGDRDHPFLNKFKVCALTNMSVDYSGSGQYASYTDSTPVHMVMNLQFQELSPIYSEDYDSPAAQGGVGY